MTRYQMKPKPHNKKATTANATNGVKVMPSVREPFDCSREQSIAAHVAVSKPNKKLAPMVSWLISRKLTINHTTAGMATCCGQPLLGGELVGLGVLDGVATNFSGC